MFGSNVTIHDESQNEFGTWKDRRSKFIIEKALRDNASDFVIITSGNAGYSLANYAAKVGMSTTCVVDTKTNPKILHRLSSISKIYEVDLASMYLDSERLINLSRSNEEQVIFDATNLFPEAYEAMLDGYQLNDFEYIVCPVGSGEAFAGISSMLEKRSSTCKLIGVSVAENPSFADKLSMTSPFCINKIEMTVKSRGENALLRLDEISVKKLYREYKDTLLAEPSATVVWGALKTLPSSAKILMINSGRGIF